MGVNLLYQIDTVLARFGSLVEVFDYVCEFVQRNISFLGGWSGCATMFSGTLALKTSIFGDSDKFGYRSSTHVSNSTVQDARFQGVTTHSDRTSTLA